MPSETEHFEIRPRLDRVSGRSFRFRNKSATDRSFFRPPLCHIASARPSQRMMIGTMTQATGSRSAIEIELTKLSSPRIFLVRMLVFLVLCSLLVVVLYKQIVTAFFANPGLNALIGAVLLIGTILSFRQVIRLYPEVAWVNNFRIADPGLAVERHPTLLA